MSAPILIPVAVDTETHLIGPGNVAPRMVCVTFAWREPTEQIATRICGNHPEDGAEEAIRKVLESERHRLVFANAAFDLTVIAASYPALVPAIFAMLREGRAVDVQIDEKLLNLSTHGQLESVLLPDKSRAPIKYNLAELQKKYLGIDRTGEKEGDDVWRLNYRELDGFKAEDYPDEARQYALDDAKGTLEVHELQRRRARNGDGSVETSEFQVAADFALRLETCWGMMTDQEEVARIRAIVSEAISEKNMGLLFEHGLFRRGEPARPFARGVKEHVEGCATPKTCSCPPKMKAAVEPTRDTKKIKAHVTSVCNGAGMLVKLTDTGVEKSNGVTHVDSNDPEGLKLALAYAACDDDFLSQVVARTKEPVLMQYQERMELDKLLTTYLPQLEGNAIVHFNYNVLVSTGRTSSYGTPKGREPLYPAANGQNQPRPVKAKDGQVADIRQCYVPRPGRVLWDVDYQALELATVGQTLHDLFGRSTHLELYNAGVDLHSYLGAQLALRFGKDDHSRAFQRACQEEQIAYDKHAVYRTFLRCKGAEGELRDWFKKYRDFAKPVGLGYPGGLGAAKFVTFARSSYGVIVTEEEAKEMKEVWFETHPDMRDYFEWVNAQHDELNPLVGDEEGEWGQQQGLWYTTPLGMVRRGATYCAVANGKAMQSPGAELAKLANFLVARACYDETQGSVLYGCRPIAFVHDQIIGETTEDQDLWHEQCMEVSRLMVEAAKMILPDVSMRTEPLLTLRWSKKAVPCFDENKRLIPWCP